MIALLNLKNKKRKSFYNVEAKNVNHCYQFMAEQRSKLFMLWLQIIQMHWISITKHPLYTIDRPTKRHSLRITFTCNSIHFRTVQFYKSSLYTHYLFSMDMQIEHRFSLVLQFYSLTRQIVQQHLSSDQWKAEKKRNKDKHFNSKELKTNKKKTHTSWQFYATTVFIFCFHFNLFAHEC